MIENFKLFQQKINVFLYICEKFMDASNIIDFGIFEDFSITFNTSNITNIFSLNHRECIASTNKEIIRFERKNIKMRFPYTFSSCLIIPETEYVIGVKYKYGTFTVFKLSDISEPILKDYKTNHHGIFHMYYSPKSSSIITIGSGIHVFTLKIIHPDKRITIANPKFSFTERSSFAINYDTTILVPPPFDPDTELIYLPTSSGICPFTLDGKQLNPFTHIPATIKTVYTFNNKTKELLIYDSTDGMSLWGSDNLICHFSTAGSSITALLFVDEENVICLNSYNSLFFLNIKTSRSFHCITMQQRPTRLFLVYQRNQPILYVCFANIMKAMKLVIPWHVWNINVANSLEIQRCDKFCESSRILIQTSNSFVKFYSPKNGEKVTVATPSLAVNPVSFYYDRGLYERYIFNKEKHEYSVKVEQTIPGSNRDVLFVILENGTIIGFDTNVSPCEEIMKIQCKARFMTICYYNGKLCYAVASENSDLYILDYQNLKETHHFTVINDKLLKMFYHFESDSIVMVFKKKTILFDLKKGQINDTLIIDGNHVTSLFSNMLLYGYESGYIAEADIVDSQLVMRDKSGNMQRPHSDAVTSFSFSLSFWISLSFDGKIIVWNYSKEKICQFSFPIPLKAGLVMNGRRDILAATESEVMIIRGNSVFDDNQVDREISEIDNFDRLKDKLSRDVKFPLPTHDDDEEENLLRARDKDKEEEYSYEEEEIDMANFMVNFEAVENQKKVVAPVENSEDDKKNKFEAMQALNGIRQVPAQVQEQLKKESLKSRASNREPRKKVKKNSSISKHDEKSLEDFINNSIEKEKEKKIQKTNKNDKKKSQKTHDGDSPQSNEDSENNIDDNFLKISGQFEEKEKNFSSRKKKEDDDEEIALRMKNEKETEEFHQERDENESSEQPSKEETEIEVPKDSKSKVEPKETEKVKKTMKEHEMSNEKVHQKEGRETRKSSSNKEKEREEVNKSDTKIKKSRVSIGTQPDSEKQSTEVQGKCRDKDKEHKEQKTCKKEEKVEQEVKKDKTIEKVTKGSKKEKTIDKSEKKSKSIEKAVKERCKESQKNTEKKQKKDTESKSKANKRPQTVKPPSSSISSNHHPSRNLKKSEKTDSSKKVPNSTTQESDQKRPKPADEVTKSPDALSCKRPRPPSPPIIRWKSASVPRKPPLRRSSTPPMMNVRPLMITIPPPNVVLDKEAVLDFYGRGKVELKPLVDLIYQENERVRNYLMYYKYHVTNYGSMSRFDVTFSSFLSLSRSARAGSSSCSCSFFRRQRRGAEGGDSFILQTRPSYHCCYFFNDADQELRDRNKNEVPRFDFQTETKSVRDDRKSDIPKYENSPKIHEMKYAPPLNLLEQGRKRPTIRQPSSSSPRRTQNEKKRLNHSISQMKGDTLNGIENNSEREIENDDCCHSKQIQK